MVAWLNCVRRASSLTEMPSASWNSMRAFASRSDSSPMARAFRITHARSASRPDPPATCASRRSIVTRPNEMAPDQMVRGTALLRSRPEHHQRTNACTIRHPVLPAVPVPPEAVPSDGAPCCGNRVLGGQSRRGRPPHRAPRLASAPCTRTTNLRCACGLVVAGTCSVCLPTLRRGGRAALGPAGEAQRTGLAALAADQDGAARARWRDPAENLGGEGQRPSREREFSRASVHGSQRVSGPEWKSQAMRVHV